MSLTGEFSLIQAMTKGDVWPNANIVKGIGDDCAVYKTDSRREQLISTDTMVEGVHFSFDYMSPLMVGARLATANISDIAAMGGVPEYMVISVAAPSNIQLSTLIGIYDGIRMQCRKYHVSIIGGDTVHTMGPIVLTITIVGSVPRGKAVYRSGARPGDLIGVTHTLGNADTGLWALQHHKTPFNYAKWCHIQPEPQVGWGLWLRRHYATAMDDISDGLASELWEIAEASQVVMHIEERRIPIHEDSRQRATVYGEKPTDYALQGGEDFQLLFTISPQHFKPVPGLTIIGTVEAGPAQVIMDTPAGTIAVEGKGYNHFHD